MDEAPTVQVGVLHGLVDVLQDLKMLIFNMSISDAYPTQARLRQKARAKAGHVPKKRPQIVEQVFDDCGEDLSGLNSCVTVDDSDDEMKDNFIESVSTYFGLNGSGF